MHAKRVKFWIAGAVLLVSFAYLAASGFRSENFVYFLTVDEVAAKGASLGHRGVRVQGKIVPRSMVRDREAMRIAFRLQGDDTTLLVRYTGVPPDLLENGFPVIAEGKIDPSGALVAKNLMVACPSKFEEAKGAGGSAPPDHDALAEQAKKKGDFTSAEHEAILRRARTRN